MADMTQQEREIAKTHFLNNIRQMNNNAVLIREWEDGQYEAVYVSDSFAQMMKCPAAEALMQMDGTGFIETTHPKDQPRVREMLRKKKADDGGGELIIRKRTATGEYVWCSANYSFINDFGERYIYCTYFDVTALKENEERLRTAYVSLGETVYQMTDRTLSMFRANLTADRIEDTKNPEAAKVNALDYTYSRMLTWRGSFYPIRSEREAFLRTFDRKALLAKHQEGEARVSMYLFSKRLDERLCFVEFSAVMTRHPITGDVIAFITERECNDDKVNETVLDKIMVRQFDMVAYLVNGEYGVVIGDEAMVGKGSIFPAYLEKQVYPVLLGSGEKREAVK